MWLLIHVVVRVDARWDGSADGRDVNHRDPEVAGETALTRRAEAGDARDVRALLAMGADPTSAGSRFMMTTGVRYSHTHTSRFLIRRRLDFSSVM